jgi:hypothetical protein
MIRVVRGSLDGFSHKEAQKAQNRQEPFCGFCAFLWLKNFGAKL